MLGIDEMLRVGSASAKGNSAKEIIKKNEQRAWVYVEERNKERD
jgi:hypothetical protein